MSDGQERTEQPTPRRLERVKAEGRWPQSALVACWLALLLAVAPCLIARSAVPSWIAMWREAAAAAAQDPHGATIASASMRWAHWMGGWWTIGGAALVACFAALGASAAGGAFGFAAAALRPRLDRLSWSAGVRQLASVEGAVNAGAALIGVTIVLWCSLPAARAMIGLAAAGPVLAIEASAIGDSLHDFWWRGALALAALAAYDAWRTRRRGALASRMSLREVREERAETEGRPEVRARRRSEGARRVRSIHIAAIAKATAIVVNPTHVAIALRYAPPDIDVPTVVSRGADLTAGLVRAIGAAHDVPIVESPELARTLYARAALGEPIPEDCYAAVAAIFAFLLQTRGVLRGSG